MQKNSKRSSLLISKLSNSISGIFTMKKLLLFINLIFLTGLISFSYSQNTNEPQIVYTVNVENHLDDLFHVTVSATGLTSENNIYNLPATVPGTYSILDFGRFVKSFYAYSKAGDQLKVERISTNKWEIKDVQNLGRIEYKIEDSFDAEISEHSIYPMSGTGIEEDFILMNTFGVLGYFEKLQSVPVKLKIDYRPDWTIGTALNVNDDGYYIAETYDHLADSPVLLGNLSSAKTKVNDIDVEVFVYSADSSINAKQIMITADDVLQSAGEFIGYSPVTHYKFLFCLIDNETQQRNGFTGAGALEHSYSSLYVYPAIYSNPESQKNDIAHEFMHILTPLNLHSEIIHTFNFAKPTASEHIWLYEGVTEWASNIMQLRSGLITDEEYLETISDNLRNNDRFNPHISLSRMSSEVYSPEILGEFINFYNRGAVTAALLDIKLLELSGGTYGLRDLFLELLNKYGKYRPFPEKKFFDIIVEMTYPEIKKFIDDYIRDSNPLPYEEYFYKLGYKYIAQKPSEDKRPSIGMNIGVQDGEIYVFDVRNENEEKGLKIGDVLLKILGKDVTLESIRELLGEVYLLDIGDSINLLVRRDGKEVEVTVKLKQRISRHLFEEVDEPNSSQILLREVWSKNL